MIPLAERLSQQAALRRRELTVGDMTVVVREASALEMMNYQGMLNRFDTEHQEALNKLDAETLPAEVAKALTPEFAAAKAAADKENQLQAIAYLFRCCVLDPDTQAPVFTTEQAVTCANGRSGVFTPLINAVLSFEQGEKKDSPPGKSSATDSPWPLDGALENSKQRSAPAS